MNNFVFMMSKMLVIASQPNDVKEQKKVGTSENPCAGIKKAVIVKTAGFMGGILPVILLLALIGGAAAVVKTPFGIFYSGEDGYDGSIAQAVAEVNADFEQKKNELLNYPADRIVITHLPDGTSDLTITNWAEVVAVFAAKTASDKADARDVVVIDEVKIGLFAQVFWEMNELSSHAETIIHGTGEEVWTETVLYITLSSKDHTQMIAQYNFTPYQESALRELLKPEY